MKYVITLLLLLAGFNVSAAITEEEVCVSNRCYTILMDDVSNTHFSYIPNARVYRHGYSRVTTHISPTVEEGLTDCVSRPPWVRVRSCGAAKRLLRDNENDFGRVVIRVLVKDGNKIREGYITRSYEIHMTRTCPSAEEEWRQNRTIPCTYKEERILGYQVSTQKLILDKDILIFDRNRKTPVSGRNRDRTETMVGARIVLRTESMPTHNELIEALTHHSVRYRLNK